MLCGSSIERYENPLEASNRLTSVWPQGAQVTTMTSLFITAFLTAWSFTVATPVHHARLASSVKSRQALNCNIGTNTNSSNFAAYNSACWNQLNTMPYLTNWTTNTPKCTATEDEQACCSISEPWSTCFLRLATGKEDAYDCTSIFFPSSPICPAPSQGGLGLQLNPYLSPDIASQANYVVLVSLPLLLRDRFQRFLLIHNLKNIIMINNFFTACYESEELHCPIPITCS